VHRDFPMPGPLVASARAWLVDPAQGAPQARPSASVLLLRDGAGGVEVFAFRRAATMAFAPDVMAFPGGGVDPRDADADPPWAGPSAQHWARALHLPEPQARQVVLAAARELFEECGVLLAGPHGDDLVGELDNPSWHADRQGLLSRSHSFAELLTARGLVLRSDLMSHVGHWVTPVCEPRRYDTHFFAAAMPHGQEADGHTTEAAQARWVPAAQMLAEQAAGHEDMLPPTQVLAEQLVAAGSVASFLGSVRPVRRVQPWPVEHSGSLWMRAPVDADGHGAPDAPDEG
jgi:8-oxo-dGTP pyrophosphatase MutT (NUDIX family)